MITKMTKLPWRFGGMTAALDRSLEFADDGAETARIALPPYDKAHLYKLDEVIVRPGQTPEKIELARVIFTTRPLSAKPTSEGPMRWYMLYLRNNTPMSQMSTTLLSIKGIQELYRQAEINNPKADTPFQTNRTRIYGLAEMILRLVDSLVKTGYIDPNDLPTNSVARLKKMQTYGLEPSVLTDVHVVESCAVNLFGEDDMACRNYVYDLLERVATVGRDNDGKIGYDISRIPREDTLTLQTTISPDGGVPVQMLTLFSSPDLVFEDLSGTDNEELGTSIDDCFCVGIDQVADYPDAETYVDFILELVCLAYEWSLAPGEYDTDVLGWDFFEELNVRFNNEVLQSHYFYDLPLTRLRLKFTKTEDIIITLTVMQDGKPRDKRFYMNLPMLSVLAPTLFRYRNIKPEKPA